MSLRSDLVERLRGLFRRGREERDLTEELAFHLEMESAKRVREGIAPAEARRRAMIALGGVERVKEDVRDARGTRVLEDLRRDAIYALRSFRRNTVFAVSVVLILALGIGANTATFTVIQALMLRSLGVPHPERLVEIGDPARTGSVSEGTPRTDLASYPVYADLRDQNHVLSGLYASGRTGRLDVTIPAVGDSAGGASSVEHPRGRLVSGNYFQVLELPAQIGRTFTAAEDRAPGSDPVVVISDRYWQRRFGGRPSVLGRTMVINSAPLTIVGVAPAGYTGDIVGQPTDVWIPLMMQPAIMPHRDWLRDRHVCWLLLMGRLAPGVTLSEARPVLAALDARSLTDHAAADELEPIRAELKAGPVSVASGARGFSYYREAYAAALATLMAAVVLVLLIVCGNVGNLMLARAEGRRLEMGMRLAMGAGRGRLVRQLLTESTMLALAGGALGLLVARWGSRGLLALASGGPSPIPLDVKLDPQVLGFTLAVSLGSAVIFGLLPAVRTTRVELAAALRSGGRGAANSAGRGPTLGKSLVAAQVALSLLLLIGTAMLVRSVQRLEHADLGLDQDRLVMARVDAQRSGYSGDRLAALVREVMRRLAAIPGVTGVSVSENGLFSGTESGTTLGVEGFTARSASDTVVDYDDVGPGYFHAVGAHLLLGRDFADADRAGAPRVAIVNRTMARFFFRDASPIGKRIQYEGDWYQIIGVVADVEEQNVRGTAAEGDTGRRLYLPMAQLRDPPGQFYVELRAAGDPGRLVQPTRQAIKALDSTLPVLSVDPLTSLIRDSISQDLLVARVVTLFGLLALALAALGLYGVMAYATSRRAGEFGVRMAMGARPGDVTRMMLREALGVTAVGVVLGVPAALLATRLLRSQLFGVGVFDPLSVALAVAVLGLSAILAGCLPALRAARVAPVEALRGE